MKIQITTSTRQYIDTEAETLVGPVFGEVTTLSFRHCLRGDPNLAQTLLLLAQEIQDAAERLR